MKRILFLMCFCILPKLLSGQIIQNLRAIHMGGNWGSNVDGTVTQPVEYFDWLKSINANWVGISIALHIDDSMDSTVSREYSDVGIPTFTDEVLTNTIQALQQNGFNVYLTLAFEAQEAENAAHPVSRWQLGDPKMPNEDSRILSEFWPWAIDHPNHSSFVKKFWETYTEQAVHFSKLAQNNGVALFSLGTETERLFRSRPSGYWPNDFRENLQAMVDSVRVVYHGNLTYDMSYDALIASVYGPGSNFLWKDIGLDVVGVSAYFKLTETQPVQVMSVDSLEKLWNNIFTDYLIPLKNRNPDLSVLFLEFGYVNAIESPFQHNYNEFQQWSFTDKNENSLDDSEETQANIYEAFFNIQNSHPGIVEGAFLWGHDIADDATWASIWGTMHHFGIRQKLAEEIVRTHYSAMSNLNVIDSISPSGFVVSQNYPNPFNSTTTINYYIENAGNVQIEVFDVLGQKIITLDNGYKAVGHHHTVWNGKNENGKTVASGIYLYRVMIGSVYEINKMFLLK